MSVFVMRVRVWCEIMSVRTANRVLMKQLALARAREYEYRYLAIPMSMRSFNAIVRADGPTGSGFQ